VTFAHVGSVLTWDTGSSQTNFTPNGVGNLIVVIELTKLAKTPVLSNISSSNVTWSKLVPDFASSVAATTTGAGIWIGRVTSTSAATVSLTWTSPGTEPAHWEARVMEFSSTVGDWALDKSGTVDTNATPALNYASLTPVAAGELYVGAHYDDNGAVVGSTSGYTYSLSSHGNGALYNASCGSGAQQPSFGAGSRVMAGTMALIKEVVSGTAAVTLKKMRVSGANPHYHTGATNSASSVSHTTTVNLTIPSTVTEGELLVVAHNVFTWTSNDNPVLHMSPAVGSWTLIDVQRNSDAMSSLATHGMVWVRQAGPSDAGSVLSFTATADNYVDDTFWHTVALAAYYDLDASHIIAAGSAGANSASTAVPTPQVTTDVDKMWGIYCGPITVNSSGHISSGPSGTTVRQNLFNAGADCAIADTNGIVGNAGTVIGGSGKTWTAESGSSWWTSFTLAVAQKTPTTPNIGAVTLRKMMVTGKGNVTGTFSVVFNSSSGGVDSYDVTSQANGSGSNTMRVIVPTNPDPAYPHSFFYMLPVEADGGFTFGDPLSVAATLGLANTFNTTIISPGYDIEPWYADNPNDTTIQQETFTIWVTQWVAANLSVTGTEKHYLTGFSKSGIGGADLILRHPDVFEKAALWDTPADDNAFNRFSTSDSNVYGTADNFTNNYQLSSNNLSARAEPFTTANRIWIAAGATYGSEVADLDGLMTSLGILHTYDGTTFASDTHAWHNDWVTGATTYLFSQVPSAHVTLKKMTISASGTPKVSGTAALTLKKMTVSGSGNTGSPEVDGTGAVTFKKMTVSGTGTPKVSGTADLTLKKMVATGTATAPVAGTSAISFKKMTVAASGTPKVSGTAALSFKKITVVGSSAVLITAAVTLKKMTVSGSGMTSLTGTGDVIFRKMSIVGSGKSLVFGMGGVTFRKMTVSGSSGQQQQVQASPLFIFSPL
jgi:hypothetical protein